MSIVTFADVVHQCITFSQDRPADRLVLDLIETRWFQRLRDISQTANTKLVYMFSEHSRFGHCLGVAYLAQQLMDRLARSYASRIEEWRTAVSVAALLHDIGHLAPGSHAAYKSWYPNKVDDHEDTAIRIIQSDQQIQSLLTKASAELSEQVVAILSESDQVPPWTWEIISGGGWNVDRGNWCSVDSVLAGVSYGRYNIPALTESMVLTPDHHLALNENRLDAMMHFAVSRHAMYRQIYQHRVILAADTINGAIVQRARDLASHVDFADEAMIQALASHSASELSLDTIFAMRESWWRYHLYRWLSSADPTLRDLSDRALNRKLFKTIRVRDQDSIEELLTAASAAVEQAGYDPKYYLHPISTVDMHAGDSSQSMMVEMDDGSIRPLSEAEPLFQIMVRESKNLRKAWLALPREAKAKLGRTR